MSDEMASNADLVDAMQAVLRFHGRGDGGLLGETAKEFAALLPERGGLSTKDLGELAQAMIERDDFQLLPRETKEVVVRFFAITWELRGVAQRIKSAIMGTSQITKDRLSELLERYARLVGGTVV